MHINIFTLFSKHDYFFILIYMYRRESENLNASENKFSYLINFIHGYLFCNILRLRELTKAYLVTPLEILQE